MPISTLKGVFGGNDGLIHMGSESSGYIKYKVEFLWAGATTPPDLHVTQRSAAYGFSQFYPSASSPNSKATTQVSVSNAPYSDPVWITDTETKKELETDTTHIPAVFNTSNKIVGASTASCRTQWRDDLVSETVSSWIGQICQQEVTVREYYKKTTLAVYHGPPVLTRFIRCSTFSVLSGSVVITPMTDDDGVSYNRITNLGVGPVTAVIKCEAFSDAADAEEELWICGFLPTLRARAVSPTSVNVEVFRDAGGTLSGTHLTTASFGSSWSWQTVGGPRNVMGHNQASASTWKITEVSGGYITIEVTIPLLQTFDIRDVGCRFYLVPKPSASVTGDY